MNAVLNPDLLFVNKNDWEDDESKDIFLNQLSGIINMVNELGFVKIYWSEELDLLLWTSQDKLPWIYDPAYLNMLLPPINVWLQKHSVNIEEALIYDPCQCNLERKPHEEVLRLMHCFLDKNESVYYITKKKDDIEIEFSCEHNNVSHPIMATDERDFVVKNQIIDEYWPDDRKSAEKVRLLIKLFEIADQYSNKQYNQYKLTEGFIKSLIPHKQFGERIISQIVKRLHMTRAEAQSDATLQDEYIDKRKERRMRVTGRPTSTRIHYIYDEGRLTFVRFYGPGEHDEAL